MARFGEINAQYFDDAGDPLGSGKLYFYESGTTTPKTTYSDINFTIANTNPVILTAAGRQPNIFFNGNAKAILTDKNDVQILVRDPVGETASNFGDAWVATKLYSADAVVLASDGQYYRSLVAANQNNDPTTTSGYWSLLYSVEWNSGISYQEGSVVTYNGEQYQSLQNSNLNNNPASATAYWVLLSFAWTSTATYADNQNAVGTDGVLYTSQQAGNQGNDPTDPANRPTYWVGTSADAAASASAASTSASNAATSASNAATSASNAATSASNAATSETNAANSASAASASATAAALTANAALWVSGQSYAEGDNAISGVNYKTYRATTATSGTTDPSASGDWVSLAYNLPSQTGNAGKFLTTNGTDESWGEVNASPTYAATASGTIANGDTVIVNSDGTVSAVSGTGAVENLGSNQVLNSATCTLTQVIYDTQNDKMIIMYRNSASGDLLGRVCTVSGDTITAGSEQTIYSNTGTISYAAITYAGSGKFVFMAGDNSINGGVSAVGSVSGTTITMGSTVQFGDNANTVERMGIAYDENAGKVVAFWQQKVPPYHSFAAVGTISGTTLSYGTPVTVTTSRGWFFPDSIAYDSTAQKLICCYVTFSASEYCRARVGTVSGTSISFGTEATVRAAITDKISATYDPDQNKTIVFYRDGFSGYDCRASVLTVSGTSLTVSTDQTIIANQAQDICSVYDTNANKTIVQFRDVENTNKSRILVVSLSGTTLTLDSELTASFEFDNNQPQIAFDPDTNKVLLGGHDADNNNYPTGAVYTTAFSNTNLTTENYIGISNGAYSDGNTATIQIVGSVDDAQSSLTAGQTYYIYFDGSLVLTPITPSVTAGTAVSATEIIVKG